MGAADVVALGEHPNWDTPSQCPDFMNRRVAQLSSHRVGRVFVGGIAAGCPEFEIIEGIAGGVAVAMPHLLMRQQLALQVRGQDKSLNRDTHAASQPHTEVTST